MNSYSPGTNSRTTKQLGDAAENRALHYLLEQGMQLLQRNYRTPGRGGGEIDLIMRSPDTTMVFVEVRARMSLEHGGAGASVGWHKQRRIVRAAQHFLLGVPNVPPCRFDVVLVEPDGLQWLQAAFDAA